MWSLKSTLVKLEMYISSKLSVLLKSRETFKYTSFMGKSVFRKPIKWRMFHKSKKIVPHQNCSTKLALGSFIHAAVLTEWLNCLVARCMYLYTSRSATLFFALPKPPKVCKGWDIYIIYFIISINSNTSFILLKAISTDAWLDLWWISNCCLDHGICREVSPCEYTAVDC